MTPPTYSPERSARLVIEAREAWETGYSMSPLGVVAMAGQLEAAAATIAGLQDEILRLSRMADQIEIVQVRISELDAKLHGAEEAAEHYCREVVKLAEMHNERADRVADLERYAKALHEENVSYLARIAELEVESGKWRRASADGIDAAPEHGVRESDRLRARVTMLEAAMTSNEIGS